MEKIYGVSNWQLTIRRAEDHVEILRAVTCDAKAILPDTLFDLPVTVLGSYALSPMAKPIEGEEIHVSSGGDGEWSNRTLQELTLPPMLNEVQNFAFYGCRSLQTLRLHDRIEHWGTDCFMNCHRLSRLYLTRISEEQGASLAFICDETREELDVSILNTNGSELRLIFPDYGEDYEENCPNHHFDFHISGGGYSYHHNFPGKQLSLRAYDENWAQYLRKQHEEGTALRLAYYRLRYPLGLEAFAEEQYFDYLRSHAEDAILWQISEKDSEGLTMLLDKLTMEAAALHNACEQARKEGNTEALALLLERQRKAQPRGLTRDFDL